MDAQKFNYQLKRIKYDKTAEDSIHDEYRSKLKIHIQRRFGELIDPEAIAEDIFLKLLEMETPGYVQYPTAWLFEFADNFIIDTLRAKHPDEACFEKIPEEFNIDNALIDIEAKKALSQLDKTTQQMAYMHFWEGYSYKELAMEFKLTYSCVRKIISQAAQILKNFL